METSRGDRARIIRRVFFQAHHHYWRGDWGAEKNRERFGDQSVSHPHDWSVEVHVEGDIDPHTGWCVDLPVLDALVDRVTSGWHGGDLNAVVPEVAAGQMMPSTENLARWLFHRLDDGLAPPARVAQVRVFESATLGSAYPAG